MPQAEIARASGDALDVLQIQKLLPHRYPFLFVDRIEQIHGDESCVGIKNVTINEPFFPGHFPGRPIMPGVIIIEGMAQTAGAICALAMGDNASQAVFFLTIDKAKFRKPVVPGDRLEYHMVRKTRRKNMWWFHGEAKVADALVCEADIGAMMVQD
jgi:3-hydroxyacyl-[acyl-carrier-protein] dehydratase